jgi:hypothetical protein
MFKVSVPELEYAPVTVPATQVRVGERLVTNDGTRTVDEVKRGPKYVTILQHGKPKPLFRGEPHETVAVLRPTEESMSAKNKATTTNRLNKRLREKHAEFTPNRRQLEVLAKLTEAAEKGHGPSSFTTSDLVAAQAADTVEARFYSMVDGALKKDENVNLEKVQAFAVEQFTKAVLDASRGLSRSTSVISNAMDDALTQAYARFIDDAVWSSL